VLGRKQRDGRYWAVTYTNSTQAHAACAKLGDGFEVIKGTRAFYVAESWDCVLCEDGEQV
jgi:hypothetical protein